MSSACIRFVLREPSQALLLCLVVSVFALILSPQSCLLPFSLSSAFCLSILPAPAPAPAPPPRLLLPPPPARFWLLWVGWLCMRVLACSYPPFALAGRDWGGGNAAQLTPSRAATTLARMFTRALVVATRRRNSFHCTCTRLCVCSGHFFPSHLPHPFFVFFSF